MKKHVLLLLLVCVLLAGCGSDTKTSSDRKTENGPSGTTAVRPEQLTRGEDAAVYKRVFGSFPELMEKAAAENDADRRLLLYAEAEAELLAGRAMTPYLTEDGAVYYCCINLNRGSYSLADAFENRAEASKLDTALALANDNFRMALLRAFDRSAFIARRDGGRVQNIATAGGGALTAAAADRFGRQFPDGTGYAELVAYYCDKTELFILTGAGEDGWLDRAAARNCLNRAAEELGSSVSWPISLDLVVYGRNEEHMAQARAFKEAVEAVLGSDRVVIRLVETRDYDGYYAGGAHITKGGEADYDLIYGIGWKPDSKDPEDFLEAFLPDGKGFLTRYMGLF